MLMIFNDRQAEQLITPGELQWPFYFDLRAGEIYDRLTGRRADKVLLPETACPAFARYKQVHVPFRGAVVRLYAHRMLFAAAHGRWPKKGMDIDHLNGDIHDNRALNLAEVTEAENTRRGRIKRFVYLLHAAP